MTDTGDHLVAKPDKPRSTGDGGADENALLAEGALTPDIIYFASVVYATAGEGIEQSSSQKTDKPMMEKALAWIDRGLRSTTHPRDNFYQLKIIVLYQLGRFEEEAECLELLVTHDEHTTDIREGDDITHD